MGGAAIAGRRVYDDRGFGLSIYFLYSSSGIPHGAAAAFRADMSALPRLFEFPALLVEKRPASISKSFPAECWLGKRSRSFLKIRKLRSQTHPICHLATSFRGHRD
jgi:hypothetical protein